MMLAFSSYAAVTGITLSPSKTTLRHFLSLFRSSWYFDAYGDLT
jgi:hypothetical protein